MEQKHPVTYQKPVKNWEERKLPNDWPLAMRRSGLSLALIKIKMGNSWGMGKILLLKFLKEG